MKKIMTICSILLISQGCVSSMKYKVNTNTYSGKYSINLTDARRESDKSSDMGDLQAASCNYGVRRLGDSQVVPDRITLLRNELLSTAGELINGLEIKINKFDIHYNQQAGLRGVAVAASARASAAAGAVAANNITGQPTTVNYDPTIRKLIGCGPEANEPGGFFLEENPNYDAVTIVVVELQLAGKSISARSVVKDKDPKATFINDAADVDGAIKSVVEKLVNKIKSNNLSIGESNQKCTDITNWTTKIVTKIDLASHMNRWSLLANKQNNTTLYCPIGNVEHCMKTKSWKELHEIIGFNPNNQQVKSSTNKTRVSQGKTIEEVCVVLEKI